MAGKPRYLNRLIADYPQSPLMAEVLTWRSLLHAVEQQRREIRRYQQDVERLSRELRREQQEIVRLRDERERLRQIDGVGATLAKRGRATSDTSGIAPGVIPPPPINHGSRPSASGACHRRRARSAPSGELPAG